jgi:hypothetical protein
MHIVEIVLLLQHVRVSLKDVFLVKGSQIRKYILVQTKGEI